jgi:cobalt-precorrin-7 (C5)-methyltransferase
MIIVGVGCGPGMITQEAIHVIRGAPVVCGSKRAIALAREYIPEGCVVQEIRDFSSPRRYPEGSVLLSTGDPMLAGLARPGDTVVPGISSLQVASARLRIPLERFSIVDAHAKDPGAAIALAVEEIARGKVVFLLADPRFPVEALAAALRAQGDITIAVCEDLGYPEERIACGTPRGLPAVRSRLFSLVIGALGSQ